MDKQEALNQAWYELRDSLNPKNKLWPIIMKLKAAIDIGEGLESRQFSKSDFDDAILRQKEGAKVFAKEMDKAAKEISKKRSVCCNTVATSDPDDDQVNNPSHYQSMVRDLNIDCITAMRAAFGDYKTAVFCRLNAFKYIWRASSKNGNEDIDKASWYLNKYKDLGGEN